ncbi:MAG TPA: TSUP family transporter [Burkholderiales bacterium]|nr:TSUP family transporter [Burkholderiales bacterium]
MSVEVLLYVALVCLVSGFAHGAIGFGFPLVATPLVALALDMKTAITLLAPVTLVLVLISGFTGGGVRELLRRFWFIPVAMAIGAFLGTRLLLAAPPEPFTLVLALMLLFYLNLDRVGRGKSEAVMRLRVPVGFAFAFAAGIFEAIANVAGPMLLVYFMLLGAAPSQIVQTLNICFSVGKGSQVATLAASGALTPATWLTVAGLSVPAVAALALGMRLRSRIDAQTYRAWLRKALWVMAIVLIAQFSASVLASEPLFRAIDRHEEAAALELVARGQADLEARNPEGDTALHRAIETGMRRLLEALLARGADLRARTKNGETALHLAALHPEPAFADLLLAAGADPRALNADGESPLHWAALSGHIVVAQRLLARGADARQRTAKGQSARDYARREGHAQIARLLERFDQ